MNKSYFIRVENGRLFNVDEELYKYVFNLEQQNQKYKEVIDKAIEYIEEHLTDKDRFLMLNEWQVPELLEILKGDSNERR